MNRSLNAAIRSALVFLSSSGPLLAVGFEAPESGEISTTDDESDVLAEGAEDELANAKLSRRHALGLSLGESKPGLVVGFESLQILTPTVACESSIGLGTRRTTLQKDGEYAFQTTVKTTMVSGGMAWWPSTGFPFALSARAGAGIVKGDVKAAQGSSGRYSLTLGELGSSLSLQSFFENGTWIKWVLLSGHYVRVVDGDYSGMSGTQMSVVRDNISGFKIIGIANLTVGYSW